eukprot:sb/3478777/
MGGGVLIWHGSRGCIGARGQVADSLVSAASRLVFRGGGQGSQEAGEGYGERGCSLFHVDLLPDGEEGVGAGVQECGVVETVRGAQFCRRSILILTEMTT